VNVQKRSPKLFIAATLLLAIAVCMAVAAVREGRDRAPLDDIALAQTSQTPPTEDREAATLRVQSRGLLQVTE
jgi:hypothetical protein